MSLRQIIGLVLVLLTGTLELSANIEFFDGSYEEALELAKKERKIIFIDAYASWCGPCKQMAKNVFTQDQVGEFYNSTFINLKLDMEKAEAAVFKQSFSVSAYPTLFFIDGQENLVHKVVGGQNGAALISAGELALSKFDVSKDLAVEYENGKRDPAFILEYIRALNASNKNSLPVSNKYLMTQKDLDTEFNLTFIYEATVACDSRIFKLFTDRKDLLIKQFGATDVEQRLQNACAATVKKAIAFESTDLLEEAIEKYGQQTNKKAAGKFELESRIYFARGMKQSGEVVTLVKKLNKSYLKGEAGEKFRWSKRLNSIENLDASGIELVIQLAREATELAENKSYWQHYYQILVEYGRTKEAEEVKVLLDALK